MDQTAQGLPVAKILGAVRDGNGGWDTRRIDMELSLRGVVINDGILPSMHELERDGLIEQTGAHTGPKWGLTAAGVRALNQNSATQ